MEPIAVIGIGCRFPGNVNSPEELWSVLKAGKDLIHDIPGERFKNLEALYDAKSGSPGKIAGRQGGYLTDIDKFAASFFDIAPKEAAYIDPQQRLLLETAWEALEDANQVIGERQRESTGVFTGIWTSDYETYMYNTGVPVNLYMTTGGSRYAASGRLSYALDTRGPSMTIDTACSSSLVALHLACQTLRSGECSLAIVGGANLILQPHITLGYARSKMLSPESRCKFGDDTANGYVRSEGVAVVVLKPLTRALAENNPIYAVIEGSAVNNDGQGSGSLVAPSLDGQLTLLREAYRLAGISPGQIQYVEAHGTGTRAGDQIELKALGTVLGKGRKSQNPCRVGSIKTNIGHTEAASGLAGLIKVALCLKYRALPASLHMHTPSARIPWSELPLIIQQEYEVLASDEKPIYAAVNSFGITGTNAHVILRNVPKIPVRTALWEKKASPQSALLPLSAHSSLLLQAVVTGYRDLLLQIRDEASLSWHDLCHAASVGRKQFKHRLALLASSKIEALEQLQAYLAGKTSEAGLSSSTLTSSAQPVFVFSDYHSRWSDFGRELLATEPAFRMALMRCDEYIRKIAGWSLLEKIARFEELSSEDVKRTVVLAWQIASIALWRSWGLSFEKAVGYDVGILAAAHAVGELKLEDVLSQVCAARSPGIESFQVFEQGNASYREEGDISPEHVLPEAYYTLAPETLSFSRELSEKRAKAPRAVATVAESQMPFNERQRRTTSLLGLTTFIQTVDHLLAEGHTFFVEMGPGSHLTRIISQSLAERARSGSVISWFSEERSQHTATLDLLRTLYLSGFTPDWGNFYQRPPRALELPRYPWLRERY
ncbi:MAG TPA: type I polyketide synthase, partial [Ktedonobacteraceae bacterium]|nr:type I polyketide synthase [Ktedonobacteraceae bacterium]